jgi:hypothetical protein
LLDSWSRQRRVTDTQPGATFLSSASDTRRSGARSADDLLLCGELGSALWVHERVRRQRTLAEQDPPHLAALGLGGSWEAAVNASRSSGRLALVVDGQVPSAWPGQPPRRWRLDERDDAAALVLGEPSPAARRPGGPQARRAFGVEPGDALVHGLG